MKKAGVPVVVVLLSGRPLILGDVLDRADAGRRVVARVGGEGVTDVLFGDYKPTGCFGRAPGRGRWRMPLTVNGSENYDPLFKFGYGLTYGD